MITYAAIIFGFSTWGLLWQLYTRDRKFPATAVTYAVLFPIYGKLFGWW